MADPANGDGEGEAGRPDPDAALNLLRSAADAGLELRVLGGLAVALHCSETPDSLLRADHADIDFVAGKARKVGSRLDTFFGKRGFESNREFNALHGHKRRLYESSPEMQIDVFVGEFTMCHKIPIGERLDVDQPTIPLAELFLTKAQVIELNEKDVTDLLALFVEHDVGTDDEETINADRVAKLCALDWGLWRTITGTLSRLVERLPNYSLPEETNAAVIDRVERLRDAVDAVPKGMKWKARARIGDRVPWYQLPDEKEQ